MNTETMFGVCPVSPGTVGQTNNGRSPKGSTNLILDMKRVYRYRLERKDGRLKSYRVYMQISDLKSVCLVEKKKKTGKS